MAKSHAKFVPLVAFECGFRNQYMDEQTGIWKSDEARHATCMSGKLDILKYCKKAYPSLNITNIVEYSHEATIDKWCKEEGSPCKWTRTVRPYHCIDGEFRSEALQVPHDCRFSHVNSREMCNDYPHWKAEASKQCKAKRFNDKPMSVRSFAVLEPCALDMFTGVEFVCCPGVEEEEEKALPLADDDDEEDDEDDSEYDEDDDAKVEQAEQDPYFKKSDFAHEHDNFKNAEKRIDDKHRAKIEKVMKEWAELEGRYQEMKKKDSPAAEEFKATMNNRFQKTVASLEEEHKRMKKELESVHEERVQAALNEKKRDATHDYRQALATHGSIPNKHNVLQKLKAYIRAEEKDRVHTLNRYRHLLRVDTAEAAEFRSTVLHRLRYIDLRINGTLAVLKDFPDLESHVRPIALEYWADYRREHTPELSDKEIDALNSLDGDARNRKLVDLYAESYERTHPNAKLDVKAPTTTTTTTTEKSKLLPVNNDDSEDDDDAYYEDEDDEEVKKKPVAKPLIRVAPPKVEEPLKVVNIKAHETIVGEAPKLVEKSVMTDSSDSDEDDDNDDERIKELRVDIEPIIEEKHSFYKKEKLIQHASEETSITTLILVASAFATALILFIAYTVRRRRQNQGFIEVDVYTPEERHVAGMQVNGYENPTYSFFDAKP